MLAVAVVLTLALRPLASRLAAHAPTAQVYWTTDISPIIEGRCVGCHVRDGFAPMALGAYQDARPWARIIREQVLARRMPPWPASRAFGEYANDHGLTPSEIEMLVAWAEGGTPLGPEPTSSHPAVTGAPLASADLTLQLGVRSVNGGAERVVVPTDLTEDRWLTAWEFLPGTASLIERVGLSVGGTPISTWSPPDTVVPFPANVGVRVPARSSLVLDVHYRRTSDPQVDRSRIGLRFGNRPRRELRRLGLDCGANRLEHDIDAFTVTPAGLRAGVHIEVVARRPNDVVVPLCVVPRYEPGYAPEYRLRQPLKLPRGTTITVRSADETCGASLDYALR
jgi:hypothetical protein